MLKLIKVNELQIFQSELLSELPWLKHGFTTKKNGYSQGVYESFNMFSADPEEFKNVIKNRILLGEALGFDAEKLVFARQVHDCNIGLVKISDIGRGFNNHKEAFAETDALVTNEKNIPIMLLYADCLPILIADKNKKVAAVIHAGWKSTALNILEKTLIKLSEDFHSKPEDLLISFGIGIGPCCFEIGEDAKVKLQKTHPSEEAFINKDQRIYANLQKINAYPALNFGVPPENIEYNDLCTFCNNELFYSYRRDNQQTGRQGAFICIKDN